MHYHIHKELQDAAIWTWPSPKGPDKGQHRTRPRFQCGEYLCKITKRYWQFLQSYRVYKAAWLWDSLKVKKGHTKVNVELVRDFYVENNNVMLQHDTCNLRKVIAFTRSSQMLLAWKFIKVTQWSRSNMVEILTSRTSLPVQLQHDAGKFWCIIIFTTWPSSKGQKCQTKVNIEIVRDFDVENISV